MVEHDFQIGDWVRIRIDAAARRYQVIGYERGDLIQIMAILSSDTDGVSSVVEFTHASHLEHCAPEPLPKTLPPGTEYGYENTRWRVVEEVVFNETEGRWRGGKDEWIGDGEDSEPEDREVRTPELFVDWSTYWANTRLGKGRPTKVRKAFDWDEAERELEQVVSEFFA